MNKLELSLLASLGITGAACLPTVANAGALTSPASTTKCEPEATKPKTPKLCGEDPNGEYNSLFAPGFLAPADWEDWNYAQDNANAMPWSQYAVNRINADIVLPFEGRTVVLECAPPLSDGGAQGPSAGPVAGNLPAVNNFSDEYTCNTDGNNFTVCLPDGFGVDKYGLSAIAGSCPVDTSCFDVTGLSQKGDLLTKDDIESAVKKALDDAGVGRGPVAPADLVAKPEEDVGPGLRLGIANHFLYSPASGSSSDRFANLFEGVITGYFPINSGAAGAILPHLAVGWLFSGEEGNVAQVPYSEEPIHMRNSMGNIGPGGAELFFVSDEERIYAISTGTEVSNNAISFRPGVGYMLPFNSGSGPRFTGILGLSALFTKGPDSTQDSSGRVRFETQSRDEFANGDVREEHENLTTSRDLTSEELTNLGFTSRNYSNGSAGMLLSFALGADNLGKGPVKGYFGANFDLGFRTGTHGGEIGGGNRTDVYFGGGLLGGIGF